VRELARDGGARCGSARPGGVGVQMRRWTGVVLALGAVLARAEDGEVSIATHDAAGGRGGRALAACAAAKVLECLAVGRECRRRNDARAKSSCHVATLTGHDRASCEAECFARPGCAGFEWYEAGSGQRCTLLRCSDPGPRWRYLSGLTAYSTWSVSCGEPSGSAAPTFPVESGARVPSKRPTSPPTLAPTSACVDPSAGRLLLSSGSSSSTTTTITTTSSNTSNTSTNTSSTSRRMDAQGAPNIIVVFADDLGVGDVNVRQFTGGLRRDNGLSTPNLQALADKGVSFTQAYSAAPVCLPSRHSLMLGRHTGHLFARGNSGVENVDIPLDPNIPTVAEVLRDAGYATGCVGKWGLGSAAQGAHPLQRGFQYFYGQISQTSAHAMFPVSMMENYGFVALPRNKGASAARCSYSRADSVPVCDFSHDLFTAKALAFIERSVEARQRFFLYLAYSTPHIGSWDASTNPSPRFFAKVAPLSDPACARSLAQPSLPRGVPVEECRHKSLIENYLDRDVGRLRALLLARGVLDNTILVFAGDNGPDTTTQLTSNDPRLDARKQISVLHSGATFSSSAELRGAKQSLWEGGLRTPLIISWPRYTAGAQGGSVQGAPVALYDLFTTFADAAGALDKLPAPVSETVSLVPSLTGGAQRAHTNLYWESCGEQLSNLNQIISRPNKFCSWAVRGPRYKLMFQSSTNSTVMFDIISDPNETRNLLATRASDPAIAAQKAYLECLRVRKLSVPMSQLHPKKN
jgi:arylsulfatase A